MSVSYGGDSITFADGSIVSSGSQGFKNKIINGHMMIDQRNAGASVTIPATTVTYTMDRWAAYGSQASKFSVQQNAGSVTPPPGFTNYLGVTSLSAYTVGSGEGFWIRQPIEGYNIADLSWGNANAKTVTLSFWVRSSLTGTFGGAIVDNFTPYSYPFSYTISSANTWEQKSITITGPTSGTFPTNNTAGFYMIFGLGNGSTSSGTAGAWTGTNLANVTGATSVVGTNGATWYVTGIQLEKGTTASSFEFRSYGKELMLCQRYYQKAAKGTQGACYGTTSGVIGFNLPVQMRGNPSAGLSTGSTASFDIIGGLQSGSIAASGANDSPLCWSGTVSSLTGRTAGIPLIYSDTNLYFSAEL